MHRAWTFAGFFVRYRRRQMMTCTVTRYLSEAVRCPAIPVCDPFIDTLVMRD
jgi:hypothetical protein